ncbi:unnamed protein product, partial [Brassica rapa]
SHVFSVDGCRRGRKTASTRSSSKFISAESLTLRHDSISRSEIAWMLADEHRKRVVIIDTSNKIGGDGDVPHSGIGRARRMQVPNVNLQYDVMIEAVENHMPETIIIDEIGTELEALAASTIAQRGKDLQRLLVL